MKIASCVTSMKIAHILLNHPWLYDRKVKTNQKANMHAFVWNIRKIKLKPRKPASAHSFIPPSPADSHVLTIRKVEKESKGVMHALVTKEVTAIDDDAEKFIRHATKPMLCEFANPTIELPNKLPLMREIQHDVFNSSQSIFAKLAISSHEP